MSQHECKDCGKLADERYTMDFTDVKPGAFLYWCAECGPPAHAMNDALVEALETRGPEFARELEARIKEAEETPYGH